MTMNDSTDMLTFDLDSDTITDFFFSLTPVEMAAASELGLDLESDQDADLADLIPGFAAVAAMRLGHDIEASDLAGAPLKDLMRVIDAAAHTPPPVNDKVAALLATLPGN